jgi:hypothetical protein
VKYFEFIRRLNRSKDLFIEAGEEEEEEKIIWDHFCTLMPINTPVNTRSMHCSSIIR